MQTSLVNYTQNLMTFRFFESNKLIHESFGMNVKNFTNIFYIKYHPKNSTLNKSLFIYLKNEINSTIANKRMNITQANTM